MGYRYATVDVDGAEVSALVNLRGPLGPRAEMIHAAAQAAGVRKGATVIIDGDEYTVRSIVNPGERNETVSCRLRRLQAQPTPPPRRKTRIK